MSTTLAFRTVPGGVVIPAGSSKQLAVVDVAKFRKIRVLADERAGSPTTMTVRLTMTEGAELIGELDTIKLTPSSGVTRVYDVPGTRLTIDAVAAAGAGNDGVDVYVYGSD